MTRTLILAAAAALTGNLALAAEQPQSSRWCARASDTDCWVDLNYAARIAMEEKMEPCLTPRLDADCLRALGWRKPLYEDERFKPRTLYRKKAQ
jgi:hypothetical protein